MKIHQTENSNKGVSRGIVSTISHRTGRPIGITDNRIAASVQLQRQIQPDQRRQFVQLRQHRDNLNQDKNMPVQKVEEEEPLQGKFTDIGSVQRREKTLREPNSTSVALPVQRVIKIESDNTTYDEVKQLPALMGAIAAEVNIKKAEVNKKVVPLKELIVKGDNNFINYAQLWNLVNPVLAPLESQYVETTPTVIKQVQGGGKYGTIPFYRAMSDKEANPVVDTGEFGMRINSSGFESGIKFFATDIGYSIGLSNKKNNEAYLKNDTLPYTRMLTALVWAPDVYMGLVNDIGIHKDEGHTAKKLETEWNKSADKPVEETRGQEWLSTVVKAQGGQDDSDEHGYVIKHETGGFNFGVKAASPQNMKGATQSPIRYFNNLVSAIFEIGKFVMAPI